MVTTFSLNNTNNVDKKCNPLSVNRNRSTAGDYDKYMKEHKFDKSILSIKE